MANINNTDKPFGFRAIKMLDMSPFNGGLLRGHIPATETVDKTFIGDGLVPVGTATGSNGKAVIMEVTEAGVNDALLGFVQAIEPDFDDISAHYRKASTARYVLLSPGINAVHVAQADAAVAITDVMDCVNIVVDTDGNTATGLSGHEMDATGVGSAGQMQYLGRSLNGEVIADADLFPLCESRVNEQELGSDSAGT